MLETGEDCGIGSAIVRRVARVLPTHMLLERCRTLSSFRGIEVLQEVSRQSGLGVRAASDLIVNPAQQELAGTRIVDKERKEWLYLLRRPEAAERAGHECDRSVAFGKRPFLKVQ